MKIRHLKEKILITVALLAGVAILYLSGVGCVFRYLFDVRCPGCGMSRAVVSALSFDFAAAFAYHPMFWSLPLLYVYFLFDGRLFKRNFINVLTLSVVAAGFLFNWIFC